MGENTKRPSAIQSKMARGALGWGLRAAADAAGVNVRTVLRIEGNQPVRGASRAKLRGAYEAAGVEFMADNGARWRE